MKKTKIAIKLEDELIGSMYNKIYDHVYKDYPNVPEYLKREKILAVIRKLLDHVTLDQAIKELRNDFELLNT